MTLLCAAIDGAWATDVYLLEREYQRSDDQLLDTALEELRRKVLS